MSNSPLELRPEPRRIPITVEAFLQAQVNTYREELRKQQRGILRLKRRIDKQRRLELENAQLRTQVRAQKEQIKALEG